MSASSVVAKVQLVSYDDAAKGIPVTLTTFRSSCADCCFHGRLWCVLFEVQFVECLLKTEKGKNNFFKAD